jgi:hypothetical protein
MGWSAVWSDFENAGAAGRYPLGRLVRSEGRYGWFETSFEGKPAILSVIESLNDEEALLARILAASRVRHRNVVAIHDAGVARVLDTPLVYAVLEMTEENLEDVLRVRALTEEETRQVAESLVQALQAIHNERLLCGELEPSSVLAAGDVVKLRSDKLQTAAAVQKGEVPGVEFQALAAKDVQALGCLLYRCLTRRVMVPGAEDPEVESLPQPFSQIVRRALGGQATVKEMDALLRQPVSALRAAESADSPVPAVPEDEQEPAERHEQSRKWAGIAMGLALLALLIFFAIQAVFRSPEKKSFQQAPAAPAVTVAKPIPRAEQAVLPRGPAVAMSGKKSVWRVVVYTYRHQDQAQHKAEMIQSRDPGLQAEVFSPKGNVPPFLVTIGGPMEHDAAVQLRNKAIREGLPRDAYVQNYSH